MATPVEYNFSGTLFISGDVVTGHFTYDPDSGFGGITTFDILLPTGLPNPLSPSGYEMTDANSFASKISPVSFQFQNTSGSFATFLTLIFTSLPGPMPAFSGGLSQYPNVVGADALYGDFFAEGAAVLAVAETPLPSTAVLFITGLIGLGGTMASRKQKPRSRGRAA